MITAAIVVTDQNNAIGINNRLLCHLPADLKFFKSITMGSPVIMGRKTYESIGRLLPGRRNIIITRDSDYRVTGADIYHSVEAALKSCESSPEANVLNSGKVFIIGGAQIFTHAWAQLHEIYRTRILHAFEADTYFPEIKNDTFEKVWEECHEPDEKNAYAYCFEKWVIR